MLKHWHTLVKLFTSFSNYSGLIYAAGHHPILHNIVFLYFLFFHSSTKGNNFGAFLEFVDLIMTK